MSPDVQIWLPPMLTLLGNLIAVVLAAWLSNCAMEANNRAIEAKIEALRAEMKQGFAELRLEFHAALSSF